MTSEWWARSRASPLIAAVLPGESSRPQRRAAGTQGARGFPGLWRQICKSLETRVTQVCRTECLRAESFTERFYTSRGSPAHAYEETTESQGEQTSQKDQSSQCPVLALAGKGAWPHQPGGRTSRHKALGECTAGSCISRNSYLEREHGSRPNTFLKQDHKDQTFSKYLSWVPE